MNAKIRGVMLAAGLLLSAGAAQATLFTEVESNDSLATAQLLGPHDGSLIVSGNMGSDGTDWFKFLVTAGDLIQLRVNAVNGGCITNDPMSTLFDPTGVQRAFNDDFNTCGPSGIDFTADLGGLWAVDVTPFANTGWDYTLAIRNITPTAVPLPGTLALLGLGFAGLGISRRMVRKS